ncbi:hypothetical protein V496_00704 [Pseudogymnoascus sp. VKM F-4515 (FW-2607)]|nr:hypothetical protein V496_00704 [Pseudogymnoascus sp. VKM F-4515 (FW-2607)]
MKIDVEEPGNHPAEHEMVAIYVPDFAKSLYITRPAQGPYEGRRTDVCTSCSRNGPESTGDRACPTGRVTEYYANSDIACKGAIRQIISSNC